jgi:hypothetical protein
LGGEEPLLFPAEKGRNRALFSGEKGTVPVLVLWKRERKPCCVPLRREGTLLYSARTRRVTLFCSFVRMG